LGGGERGPGREAHPEFNPYKCVPKTLKRGGLERAKKGGGRLGKKKWVVCFFSQFPRGVKIRGQKKTWMEKSHKSKTKQKVWDPPSTQGKGETRRERSKKGGGCKKNQKGWGDGGGLTPGVTSQKMPNKKGGKQPKKRRTQSCPKMPKRLNVWVVFHKGGGVNGGPGGVGERHMEIHRQIHITSPPKKRKKPA